MEFFRIVDIVANQAEIQKEIGIGSISRIYPDIIVLEGDEKEFQIGSIWGEFNIRRDNINGGIRFSMLNCPNALAWTITTGYPPAREKIIIHLTINRQQKQPEFIEEIEEFLNGWQNGLKKVF